MGKYLHHYETENEFEPAYYGSDYHEPWVSYTNEDDFTPHVDYNKVIDLEVLPSLGDYWAINLATAKPCFGLYGETETYGGVKYSASGECITYSSAPDMITVKVNWPEGDVGYYTMSKRGSGDDASGSVFYEANDVEHDVLISVTWDYFNGTCTDEFNQFYVFIGNPV